MQTKAFIKVVQMHVPTHYYFITKIPTSFGYCFSCKTSVVKLLLYKIY